MNLRIQLIGEKNASLTAINDRFNKELRDYNNTGTFPANERFNLGPW